MELRRPSDNVPDEKAKESKELQDRANSSAQARQEASAPATSSRPDQDQGATAEARPSQERDMNASSESESAPQDEPAQDEGSDLLGNAEKKAEPSRPKIIFKDRRIFSSDIDDLEIDEEPSSDKPTYVEQLEKRVAEAESRLAEYIKAYKEKTEVEWAELKARLEKDLERQVLQAKKEMVLDLLEVLDNFTRTIESAKTASDIQSLLTGMEMIERQFLGKLQALGLELIEAEDAAFDPNIHEAAGIEEVDDESLAGKVVEVYQQGYSFGGQLLRPALVRVAKLRQG